MAAFDIVVTRLRAILRDRQRLVLENLALHQQAAVLRRGVKHPKLDDQDRIFWITMLRLLNTWREVLHIVQADTVIRWHRRCWRTYWGRKLKARKLGRSSIACDFFAVPTVTRARSIVDYSSLIGSGQKRSFATAPEPPSSMTADQTPESPTWTICTEPSGRSGIRNAPSSMPFSS